MNRTYFVLLLVVAGCAAEPEPAPSPDELDELAGMDDKSDAASLLTDRITPRLLGDAAERRLIERFARAGAPQRFGGVDPHEAFVLCALQRVLKVIGRFNYLSEVKGKPRYAEMLPAIVPTARRLCSGRSALAATASLLETHVKGGAQ